MLTDIIILQAVLFSTQLPSLTYQASQPSSQVRAAIAQCGGAVPFAMQAAVTVAQVPLIAPLILLAFLNPLALLTQNKPRMT
jgi:hypothetical protein